MNNVESFLKEVRVYDCNLTKMHLGPPHDGGYIVAKELCEISPVLYSCGIGDDVGFELDFVRKFSKSQAFLFDHTIDESPLEDDRLFFYKQKVDSSSSIFQSQLANASLKMDIEWDEWKVFLEVSREQLRKFSQIVCEFHLIHVEQGVGHSPYFLELYQGVINRINDDLFSYYSSMLKKLNEVFYIFHVHANNSLPEVWVQGYHFPPLLELSFARRDLVELAKPCPISFPVRNLDYPNKSDRSDIYHYSQFGD